MRKPTTDTAQILIGAIVIFFMIFLWNIMIVNHGKDIDRDQYLIDHCKRVDLSYGQRECDNNTYKDPSNE